MNNSIPNAQQCLPDHYGDLTYSVDHLQDLPDVNEGLASLNQTFPDTNEGLPNVRQGSLDSSNSFQNIGQDPGVTIQDPLNAGHAVHDGDGEVGEQSESSDFTLYSNISHKIH